MDLFRRFLPKAATCELFSFWLPQAPVGLQNSEYLRACASRISACTKGIAASVAMMHLTRQEKQGDEWKEVTTGVNLAALDLLTTVNPFLTSDALWRAATPYLDLTGNAFLYVAYNARRPAELWLLNPTKVEVVKSETTYIQGYVYTNPKGEQIRLRVDEVIPFQEFNPADPFRRKRPLEAAAVSVDSDCYSSEWNRNFCANYSDERWKEYSADRDEIYEAFELPNMIGETGYNPTTSVPFGEKHGRFERHMDVILSKPYVKDVWVWGTWVR